MENSISFSTKFGWISAFARGNKVTSIQFKELKQKHSPSFILYKLRKNINLYFQGKKKRINISIELSGNLLQKKIWKEIKNIKRGDTKSYGQIAKKLKISPRYVGKVCGQNLCLLVIPCHRVINADGSLGGFSAKAGISLKRKLLIFEQNESFKK